MIATKTSPEAVTAAKASLKAASELKFSPAVGSDSDVSSHADSAETDSKDMSLAAYAIFSGATNTFTTTKGKVVIVKQATMKQIPIVLRFFQECVGGLDQHSLITLVDLYADRQKKAMAAGKNPNDIDLGPGEEEEGTEAIVGKVFGNISLLTQLLTSAAEVLPELAAAFTNLTEEEYDDLGVDEGLTLVGAIFLLNAPFYPKLTANTSGAYAQRGGAKAKRKKPSSRKNADSPPKVSSGAWLNQAVSRLIRRGHSLEAIGNYTLSQFMMCLKGVEQMDAADRLDFVSDMSAVVGSLFSKDSPISEHVASLVDASAGIKNEES